MSDLTTATPVEIDTRLAELYRQAGSAEQKVIAAAVTVHYALGEKAAYVTRNRKTWPTTDAQAIEAARARGDERTALTHGGRPFSELVAKYDVAAAALAAIESAMTPLDAEFERRGGWSRFFEVQNNGGHIHSSMNCKTCNRGGVATSFGWHPELSGMSEEEALATFDKRAYRLCTVCFPNAPVEWRTGKKADHCDGSRKAPIEDSTKRTGMYRYGDCTECTARPIINADGTVRAHKPKELREQTAPAPVVEDTAPVADVLAEECLRYDHSAHASGCPAHPDTQWPGQIAALAVEEVAPAAPVSEGCQHPATAVAITEALPVAPAVPHGAQGELFALSTGTAAVFDDAGQAAGSFPECPLDDGHAGLCAVTPALDGAEERRAVAGRVFARQEGLADAGDGCTLYRMVRARVGERQIRIHGAAGELLGTVTESAEGWRAELPTREPVPMFMGAVPGGGWLGRFTDAVEAVRAAERVDAEGWGEAIEDDDQGATEAAREGESVEGKAMRVLAEEAYGATSGGLDAVAALNRLIAQGREEVLVPLIAPGRQHATVEELEAALRGLVVECGIKPAVLRRVADQVERDQAGHVTEIQVDEDGRFQWRCVQGDADQTGIEVGEEAYQAAVAHGPLVATSPFVRGPVIEHEGRAENEAGVPRRALGGSLHFEPYDGDEWVLRGYGRNPGIGEGDIAGAHAWAAGLIGAMAEAGYAVSVARWEQHRDAYGEWWEPVAR